MKKPNISSKKLIAVLLIVMLVAHIGAVLPAMRAKALEDDQTRAAGGSDKIGSDLVHVGPYRPRDPSLFVGTVKDLDSPFDAKNALNLPSSYSLTDAGRVTSVKNQNPYGSCWAFAAVSSAESSLVSSGKADVNDIDLSEKHLAYFTYNASTDKLGNTAGDTIRITDEFASDGYLDLGGNQYIAKSVLAAQYGLVDESVMPYNNSSDPADIANEKSASYPASQAYSDNSYVVDKVHIVSLGDRDYVKQSLVRYGAAVISIYFSDWYMNYFTDDGTNIGAYYNDEYNGTNHDVTLVGWDDNYDRNNFPAEHRPAENGAWLIKNSWSGDWGHMDPVTYRDDGTGYFWVSYEDAAFAPSMSEGELYYPDIFFYQAVPASEYQNVYQYDGAGGVESITAKRAASVYKAASKEYISAVEVGMWSTNNDITVQVYKNVTNASDPTSGTLAATKRCVFDDAGVAKVKLDSTVAVAAGKLFSIVVTSNNEETEFITDSTEEWQWVKFNSNYKPGHCAVGYGEDEITWYDADEDIAIKALTRSTASVPATSLSFATNPVIVDCGMPEKLDLIVEPANYTGDVTWSYDEDNVVVSENGYVTAFEPGTYTVSASVGNLTANCTVTAIRKAKTVEIGREAINMVVGDERTLSAQILPADNTEDLSLSWSSSDDSVATVSSEGKITAVAPGTVSITAYTEAIDGTLSASCEVTVVSQEDYVELQGIVLEGSELELVVGEAYRLEAQLVPENATYNEITWSSSDDTVALVAADGVINGVDVGNAVITAAGYGGVSAQCAVTVLTEAQKIEKYAEEIQPDTLTTVLLEPGYIDDSDPEYIEYGPVLKKWFKYTPAEDHTVVFSSSSYPGKVCDPYCMVYDMDMNCIVEGDDTIDESGNTDRQFKIQFNAYAGHTYLLMVNVYNETGGKFIVLLEQKPMPVSAVFADSQVFEVPITQTKIDCDDTTSVLYWNDILEGKTVTLSFSDGTSREYVISQGMAGIYPIGFYLDPSIIQNYEQTGDESDILEIQSVYEEKISDQDGNIYEDANYIYYYTSYFYSIGDHSMPLYVDGTILNDAVTLRVDPVDISEFTLEPVENMPYTGEEIYIATWPKYVLYSEEYNESVYYYDDYGEEHYIENAIVDCSNSVMLVEDYDYDVDYADNINPGKASATLTDSVNNERNIITGSRTVYFNIANPAPSNVKAASAGYNSIKLTWSNPGTADGYLIVRSTAKKGKYTTVGTSASPTFTDTGLDTGTDYYYRVRAYQTIDGKRVYGVFCPAVSAKPVPAAPGSPKAVSAGYESIKLTWAKVAGADGYHIVRSTAQNGTYTTLKTLNALTYTDTGLTTGASYYYKIRAYRTVNGTKVYGSYTPVLSGKPVPAVTGSLKAARAGYESVKLTWTKVAGAVGYQVARSTEIDGTYTAIKATNDLTFTDTGLKTGTTYYYKVRAYSKLDGKNVFGSYTAAVSAKPTLSAPGNPGAASAGYDSVKLTWAQVDGATGYRVYRSTEQNGTYTAVKAIKALTYTDTDLISGTTYYYKIRAYRTVDGANIYSGYSSAVNAKPIPAAPESLKAASAGYDSVKLTWAQVDGATGYRVYRSTEQNGTYTAVKAVKALTYTDTGLTAGKTYYYKVRTYRTVDGANIYSGYSSAVNAKPVPAKTTLTVTKASTTSAKLTWTKVDGASGYEIRRSTSKDGTYTLVKTTTGTSFTDSGLTAKGTYYYKVRAYSTVDGSKVYGSNTESSVSLK